MYRFVENSKLAKIYLLKSDTPKCLIGNLFVALFSKTVEIIFYLASAYYWPSVSRNAERLKIARANNDPFTA